MTDPTILSVPLTAETLAALDAWIARCDAPRPSRAEAVARVLGGALGSHAPSTVIPGIVTGRDIV